MRFNPRTAALAVAILTAGVAGTSTAALADPPWARGGYGYHHGGPPPWAPAHGWRRHHERWGYDRPYRTMRFREERRGYGFRY